MAQSVFGTLTVSPKVRIGKWGLIFQQWFRAALGCPRGCARPPQHPHQLLRLPPPPWGEDGCWNVRELLGGRPPTELALCGGGRE